MCTYMYKLTNVNNFHTAIDNVFKNKHNKNKQCAYFSSPALQCAYFLSFSRVACA